MRDVASRIPLSNKRFHRFDVTRPFGLWLKRIAVIRAIDQRRRERRADLLDERQSTLAALLPVGLVLLRRNL